MAEGFQALNVFPTFVVRGQIDEANLSIKTMVQFKDWFQNHCLYELLKSHSIVIVDSYQATFKLLKRIGERTKFPVYLVDSTLNYYPKGLVFFPSIYFQPKDIAERNGIIVFGGKPFLLFSSLLWDQEEIVIHQKVRRVGISLGVGSNGALLDDIIFQITRQWPEALVTVFAQANNPANQNSQVRFLGIMDKKNYFNEIRENDLMIVNGGQTLNENVLLGIPTISLILASNQEKNARKWEELGCSHAISAGEPAFHQIFQSKLLEYQDFEFRRSLSSNMRNMVNSKGAIAAAYKIMNIAKQGL